MDGHGSGATGRIASRLCILDQCETTSKTQGVADSPLEMMLDCHFLSSA